MTVKDLLDKLEDFPPNHEVFIECQTDEDWRSIITVEEGEANTVILEEDLSV